jgi:hypothetical protein
VLLLLPELRLKNVTRQVVLSKRTFFFATNAATSEKLLHSSGIPYESAHGVYSFLYPPESDSSIEVGNVTHVLDALVLPSSHETASSLSYRHHHRSFCEVLYDDS